MNTLPANLRLGPYSPNQIIRLPLYSARDIDDAPEILGYLKQLAIHYGRSPYVREFVRSILPPFTGHNDTETLLRTAIDFVRDRVVYLPDPNGTEYVIDPIALLELIRTKGRAYGDCDDKALLLASMLGAVGFDVRIVGVHLHEPIYWDHVIVGVYHRGVWRDVDPCVRNNEFPNYGEKLIA